MSEEENLRKAYFVLGLEPGASLETINRRYKRLIMVWHPDRFPTADGKHDAQEELKQINNAKDKLKAHFDKGGHKASGPCACRAGTAYPAGGGRTSQGPGPGPARRAKTAEEAHQEEAQARSRSEQRARRASEETAQKNSHQTEAGAFGAAQEFLKDALDQSNALEEERVRWKIAACLGVAWLILSLFGWVGTGIEGGWSDFTRQWQSDHPSHSGSANGTTNFDAAVKSPTYVPPPDDSVTIRKQQEDLEQQRRDEAARKQKDQDIYFTKLEIDKWQKSIEHSTTTIANLEAQIANPAVSEFERTKLRSYQNFQRRCLGDAQASLDRAQQKLADLSGTQPPLMTIPSESDRSVELSIPHVVPTDRPIGRGN